MIEWIVFYDRKTGKELERHLTGGMIQGDVEMHALMVAERLGVSEDDIECRFESDNDFGRLRVHVVFYEITTGRELLAEEVTEETTETRVYDLLSLVAIDNDLRTDYVGKRFELR